MMILAEITPLALEGNTRLAVAILMGILFGVLLIKAEFPLCKPVREALILKNGPLCKTFVLSIGAGALLFYFLNGSGIVNYHVRSGYLWPSLLGGIIAGLGMALCLRVPITAVAALAAGKIHVLWVILGMIVAVPCVTAASNWLSDTIFQWGTKLERPEHVDNILSFSNPTLWVVVICAVVVLVLQFTLGSGVEKEQEKEKPEK